MPLAFSSFLSSFARDTMDITAVNALSYEDFLEIFGNVVEKCPIIPAAIWIHRPFTGLADIEAHISDFIDCLPESGTEVDQDHTPGENQK